MPFPNRTLRLETREVTPRGASIGLGTEAKLWTVHIPAVSLRYLWSTLVTMRRVPHA